MKVAIVEALLILAILIIFTTYRTQGQYASKKSQSITNLRQDDGSAYRVEEAMNRFGLRGLSVAVFENYQIAWTASWGVKDTLSREEIDPQTAFSAASIAKPVTATLLVMLEQQGLIDLEVPVDNYLIRWQIPKSKYTDTVQITLAHLLSHTAGTSQHGFRDFYAGDTIPTMIQSLNGDIPHDNSKIEFLFTPGSTWSYSGGGYVIAQMALEDHLGQSLADLAREYLFEPLGMQHTTFRQPYEAGFLTNVARAHDQKGTIIRTGLPITPQIAPSGLWTTPKDMAVFMIEIQKALQGMRTSVISPQVAQRVTDIVTTAVMEGWSLGWERRFGYGNYQWFSHGGANTGIGGHIYATMEDGHGIAFFGNGPNNVRIPVLDQLRNSIIKAHGWYRPLDLSGQKELSPEMIKRVSGNYTHLVFGDIARVEQEEGKLWIKKFVLGRPTAKLWYLGDNTFLVDEYPAKIKFEAQDGALFIRRISAGAKENEDYVFKRTGD